ncbi:hypothetical protein VTN77DRAFT_622 [Rasamsonia byssochlamydoides]|uniref:uncharacterized protein n=1 Tax=Rasamsonia byssochlamydoides TaxID=89139 RepID=UPI003742D706
MKELVSIEKRMLSVVASRCEGDAAKHIAKRLRENALDRYRDSNDLLKHLKQIYHDPNRIANAKFKFRELRMKGKDKFHDFVTFSSYGNLYYASEAIPRAVVAEVIVMYQRTSKVQ